MGETKIAHVSVAFCIDRVIPQLQLVAEEFAQ